MSPASGGVQEVLFYFSSFRSGCWGKCGWVQRMLQPLTLSVRSPGDAMGSSWRAGSLGTCLSQQWCPCGRGAVWWLLLAASHSHGDCCRTASSLGIFFLTLNLLMHWVHEGFLSVLSVASLTRDVLSLEKSVRNSHKIS